MYLGRRSCAASISLVWLLNVVLVSAQAGPYDPIWVESASSNRATIEKALDQPAEFDFAKVPLTKVVDSLGKKYAIGIQLDRKSLEEAGVSADAPITCQLKHLSLRSALRRILFDLDLTSVIRYGSLLITTTAQAETITELVLYPVDDLILPPESVRQPGRRYQSDYDSLVQMLASTISPTAWAETSGAAPIVPYHGALLIPQTNEVHAEIAEILAELRAVRNAQFAAPDKVGEAPAPTAAQRRREVVCQALHKPVDFEFVDKSLPEIAQAIMDQCKIAVHLDLKALEEAGVELNQHITRRVHGIALRDALALILEDLDLTWVIRDEVLLITVQAQAQTIPETRVYPVAGLGTPTPPAPHRPPMEDYENVIELLMGSNVPTTWAEVGGQGTAVAVGNAGAIVVSQMSETHEQIEDLFSSLRKIRGLERAGLPAADLVKSNADELVTLTYRLPGTLGWHNEVNTREVPTESERFAKQLAEAIIKHVEPKSWGDSDGQGSLTVVGNQLLVRQRMVVHDQIADFLAKFNGFGNGNRGMN